MHSDTEFIPRGRSFIQVKALVRNSENSFPFIFVGKSTKAITGSQMELKSHVEGKECYIYLEGIAIIHR
jgi:hypothetical protein